MRHDSRNSEPVYKKCTPMGTTKLPATATSTDRGIEISRNYQPDQTGLFGAKSVRHYGMKIEGSSALPVILDGAHAQALSAEIEGAIRSACGIDNVTTSFGIPTPSKGSTFTLSRPIDVFGGSLTTLPSGTYTAGDVTVDRDRGRVWMELERLGVTHFVIVGLFMAGHSPACVDWRIADR